MHNARSILVAWYREGDAVWHQFKGGKEGTLWFYRSLLKVYQPASKSFLAEELEQVISRLV